MPFIVNGIPAITVNREGSFEAFGHTPQDALAQIDAEHLEHIGRFIDVFMTRTAAEAYVWPFEREVSEEDRREFEKMASRWITLLESDET